MTRPVDTRESATAASIGSPNRRKKNANTASRTPNPLMDSGSHLDGQAHRNEHGAQQHRKRNRQTLGSQQIKGHDCDLNDKSASERADQRRGRFSEAIYGVFQALDAFVHPRPLQQPQGRQQVGGQFRYRDHRNRQRPRRRRRRSTAIGRPARGCPSATPRRRRTTRPGPMPSSRAPDRRGRRWWRASSSRRPTPCRQCARRRRRCCSAGSC